MGGEIVAAFPLPVAAVAQFWPPNLGEKTKLGLMLAFEPARIGRFLKSWQVGYGLGWLLNLPGF